MPLSRALQVPGKSEVPKLRTRAQEWRDALVAAPETVKGLPSEACREVLELMAAHPENIPRKEKKFLGFLNRSFRVQDNDVAKEAWRYMCIVDEQLNSVPLDPGKQHISATEIVRASHKKVWNVHRLDCETSGVLVMAFSEEATAHLSAQFREGRTRKRYLAVVSGLLDAGLTQVTAPIRADFENKPLQVSGLSCAYARILITCSCY